MGSMEDVESHVRKIEGREYLFVEYGRAKAVVQDFIRFPHVVPIEDEEDLSPQVVENLQRNSRRPTASAMTQGQYAETWITGDPHYPVLTEDHQTAIGVEEALTSDLVSHAVATDLTGLTIGLIARGPRRLPVGLLEVASDTRVVDLWASRGQVGMYRRHVRGNHAVKRLSNGVTTELHAADPAATAIQYAITFLKAESIALVSCDPTFEQIRHGSIRFDERYVYPKDLTRMATLHAMCLVAVRNHVEVSWTKGTMAQVPGARPIDRTPIEASTQ